MPLILDAPSQFKEVIEDAASYLLQHPGALDHKDLSELLGKLRDLRAASKALGDVVRFVDAACCRQANWTQVVEGFGVVDKRRGADRKQYEHRGLALEVLRAANRERIDTMTGEVTMSEGEAVMKSLLSCIGISYWKVGELKGRGINVDDFCSKEPGRESIVFSS